MRLVNTIMLRKYKALSIKAICSVLALSTGSTLLAQDNSPYSRYGLGNLVPNTNISTRGMGGISAAYADRLSVNFNNPASYSNFQTYLEERSGRMASGRVLLDVGLNFENRTLQEPNQPQKFTSSNALFSYLQVGIPLRKNWGLSFGLRPLTRVYYKVGVTEPLRDHQTGDLIDTTYTEYTGDGGTFLPSIGTGYAIKNFSVGVNVGYLFGKKEIGIRRAFLKQPADYYPSFYHSNASFGDIYFNAGAQYRIKMSSRTFLSLGVSGNLQQDISASQDIIREVYSNITDTVFYQKNVKGSVTYPASYTGGVVLESTFGNTGSYLFGADIIQSKWSDYRYFGRIDSVQDNWQLRVGGHYRPNAKAGSGYFSNVTYRAGFFYGNDYIKVDNTIPQFGISFGMGLPLANYSTLGRTQYTIINLALEYEKRGNNSNPLKEDVFRLSVGLNFSDLWFTKRRYD